MLGQIKRITASGLVLNNNSRPRPSSLHPRHLTDKVTEKKTAKKSTYSASKTAKKSTNSVSKTAKKSTSLFSKTTKKTKAAKIYKKSPAFFKNLK